MRRTVVLGAIATGVFCIAVVGLAVAAIIVDRSLNDAQRLWALAGIGAAVAVCIGFAVAFANVNEK